MATVISQQSALYAPEVPDVSELPDHTQLPDKDGNFVRNFQEPPQSGLLKDSLRPVLQRLFPDGQYCIGQDSGIYWRLTEPPLLGCKSPDWYLVPGVPPMLAGRIRRSYVLWQERKIPLIAIEIVSGDGAEERDRTPQTGKFWVYEQGIQIPYYAIFEAEYPRVEVHHLENGFYQPIAANDRGRFLIPPLEVEMGIWHGDIDNQKAPWLRWWDLSGNLLLTSEEKEELERQRAETAEQRAETAEERAKRLAEKLRSLGIDPDQV